MRHCVQYAERLPIGLESIIRSVSADTVRAFYKRWYRPEHMAVTCMGDFDDPDAVVAQLRAAFQTLQGSSEQRAEPLPQYGPPLPAPQLSWDFHAPELATPAIIAIPLSPVISSVAVHIDMWYLGAIICFPSRDTWCYRDWHLTLLLHMFGTAVVQEGSGKVCRCGLPEL